MDDFATTKVVFVRKQHAKFAKIRLKKNKLLDCRFRMVQADKDAVVVSTCTSTSIRILPTSSSSNTNIFDNNINFDHLIAIPILIEGMHNKDLDHSLSTIQEDLSVLLNKKDEKQDHNYEGCSSSILVGIGDQSCPYSTRILGNNCKLQLQLQLQLQPKIQSIVNFSTTTSNNTTDALVNEIISNLSLSQLVLLDLLPITGDDGDNNDAERVKSKGAQQQIIIDQDILDRVIRLDADICPGGKGITGSHQNINTRKQKSKSTALEIFGDDRTIVIPPNVFRSSNNAFLSILREVWEKKQKHNSNNNHQRQQLEQQRYQVSANTFLPNNDDDEISNNNINKKNSDRKGIVEDDGDNDDDVMYDDFWRRLALAHNSHRIVRRGGVDPNSKIRESGHRLVWFSSLLSSYHRPLSLSPSSSTIASATVSDINTGKKAATWITITEQGIKQSFDLTKVMFSRGNISEKIRFGRNLVNENDVLLDMYAGIGYYTLPALIHGKASFVYACEWNPYAIQALRYNIAQNSNNNKKKKNIIDNNIQSRIMILEGDCREQIEKHNIVGKVDRVSLGLLPSSEGGWSFAIHALKDVTTTGGWLHIHGNVPVREVDSWIEWVCYRLEISLLSKQHQQQKQQQQQQQQQQGEDNDNISTATTNVNYNNTFILCNHVERVKSFAPNVCHYVADIFVGPKGKCIEKLSISSLSSSFLTPLDFSGDVNGNNDVEVSSATEDDDDDDDDDNDDDNDNDVISTTYRSWVRRRGESRSGNGEGRGTRLCDDQSFCWIPVVPATVRRPSCALSPDGILSQRWMR